MKRTEVKTKLETSVINPDKIPRVLKKGEFGLALDWAVWDTKTKEVTEQRSKRGESFLRQFLDIWYMVAEGTHPAVASLITDYTNTGRWVFPNRYTWTVTGAAGDVTRGIIVGTGNTAPDISNYYIETLIAHGVGAGQLQYSLTSVAAPASDVTTSQFTITRNFANGSGGAITVNEIACCVLVQAYPSATSYYFTIIRDVIAGGIAVPNGQTLTVNYRPQAVV